MTDGDRLAVMQITEHKFTLELKKKKTQVLSVGTLDDLLCFLKNYLFLPTLGEWPVTDQLIWRSSERGLETGRGEKIDHNLHNQ